MSVAQAVAVVLDPTGEVAEAMTRIEDWLLFSEPDSSEADATVRAGARAAGAIGLALVEATGAAPSLYAPGGHFELAPLAVISGDLGANLGAVHRALLALLHTRPPSGTFRALDLLCRCAVRSAGKDGEVLAGLAEPGAGSVRLSPEGYRIYERFARAVLVDPLERFAALGSPSAAPCGDAACEVASGEEVGL